MMLAGVTKTAELMLSDDEAKSLAVALNTVNGFYNVKIAEKTVAWVNLAMVAGTIYGTRLVAIRQRTMAERAMRRNAAAEAAPAQTEVDPYAGIPAEYMSGMPGA
jgi:predicted DNA-binding transcriptional regulator YafY